jgi:hypothetical protein
VVRERILCRIAAVSFCGRGVSGMQGNAETTYECWCFHLGSLSKILLDTGEQAQMHAFFVSLSTVSTNPPKSALDLQAKKDVIENNEDGKC